MRISWCIVWLAVLIAIVLCIPLIERGVLPSRSTVTAPGQEAPLLPVPQQQRP
ncbi:hypothetical protein J2858_000487 [Neorhizobium galegae]|uniref:hypothetical protein n=1 Tax=Rhizobium/Agrobacterium group TaxID=227290 RepID=UPI001AE3AB59|nr:hypothetical protein [Neorhizobium galegae]MBP2547594.1 hypothetical protein [Neorhizobium galegae]